MLLVFAAPVRSQEEPETAVVVTGERNPDNRYRELIWTVRNTGIEPITSFIAPARLGGDLIQPPDGWSGVASDASIGNGKKIEVVEFHADRQEAAIRLGGEKIFTVRIHADLRWQPVPRTVAVGFANGSEVLIDGVICPQPESTFQHNFPAIGLGVIFATFLIVKAARKPKQKNPTSDEV